MDEKVDHSHDRNSTGRQERQTATATVASLQNTEARYQLTKEAFRFGGQSRKRGLRLCAEEPPADAEAMLRSVIQTRVRVSASPKTERTRSEFRAGRIVRKRPASRLAF